jgi:hypothetical protein
MSRYLGFMVNGRSIGIAADDPDVPLLYAPRNDLGRKTTRERVGSRRTFRPAGGLLAATMALTACVGSQSLDQPLSPLVVRGELVDRTVVATENGETSFIHLAQNGVATVNGTSAEFGRWQFDENGALCVQWRGQPQRCAPVYAAGGSHYRFGEMDLSVLSSR